MSVKIARKNALETIEKNVQNGQIFSATFTKKNGETRKLVGRKGVAKYTKGGELAYEPAAHNLIGVFDMQKLGYRMISVDTLTEVKANGVVFEIVD